MIKHLTILACLLALSNGLYAQWDTISTFNQVISDLQTHDGKLFLGGGFTKNEDQTCNWSAYYNGNFITRHTALIGGSGIRQMAEFNGELYSVGALHIGFGTGVSLWDGSTWVDGGSTNYSHSVIYADENDLYVVSDDDIVRKKTGTGTFEHLMTKPISAIVRYKDDLIFAGNFDSINGVMAKGIAAWDGTTWRPLAGGTSGGIGNMIVYKDELYVSGSINNAGGVSVKRIAKWDGTEWFDVGGGITGNSFNGIRDMAVYRDHLIIVGDFDEVGSSSMENVAMWDGSTWKGLDLGFSFPNCVEVYDDKLYVGTFDFDRTHLLRYAGDIAGTGASERMRNISIYPNPVNEVININIEIAGTENIQIQVMDMLGKVMLREEITLAAQASINCSALKPGTYILWISDGTNDGTVRRKLIKI
ncbi:MAG: T9SS type A sorting domain-containing protein [Bacteroidia bacterium]